MSGHKILFSGLKLWTSGRSRRMSRLPDGEAPQANNSRAIEVLYYMLYIYIAFIFFFLWDLSVAGRAFTTYAFNAALLQLNNLM